MATWVKCFSDSLLGGFVYGGFSGKGGFDLDKAFMGGISGAMVGAGLGLAASGGPTASFVRSLASGSLMGGGMGGLGSFQAGKSADLGAWATGTFIGAASGAAAATVGYVVPLGLNKIGLGKVGGGVVREVFSGAAGSMAANATSQGLSIGLGLRDPDKQPFSWRELAFAGLGGGVGGLASWGLTRNVLNADGSIKCGCVSQVNFLTRQALGGAAGGFIGDAMDQVSDYLGRSPEERANWSFDIGRSLQATAFSAVSSLASGRSMWANNRVCFAAGTPLLTPTGSRPIEEFRVGDLVLSRWEFNPEGPVEAKQVEEVFINFGPILHVHVGGKVIRTTAEHPFYVRDKGWTAAADLQVGDLLSSHDGQWVPVEDLLDTGEWETVYNLRVADYHTYFVGSPKWGFSVWSHNLYIAPLGERGRFDKWAAKRGFTPVQADWMWQNHVQNMLGRAGNESKAVGRYDFLKELGHYKLTIMELQKAGLKLELINLGTGPKRTGGIDLVVSQQGPGGPRYGLVEFRGIMYKPRKPGESFRDWNLRRDPRTNTLQSTPEWNLDRLNKVIKERPGTPEARFAAQFETNYSPISIPLIFCTLLLSMIQLTIRPTS